MIRFHACRETDPLDVYTRRGTSCNTHHPNSCARRPMTCHSHAARPSRGHTTCAAAMGDALRSVPPHQYTHIFVAGLVFAAADAFATGANDIGTCLLLLRSAVATPQQPLARRAQAKERRGEALTCLRLLPRRAANSFATSCASRALTFRRAWCIAVVTEFSGAVLLGSNVARTIKGAVWGQAPALAAPHPSPRGCCRLPRAKRTRKLRLLRASAARCARCLARNGGARAPRLTSATLCRAARLSRQHHRLEPV